MQNMINTFRMFLNNPTQFLLQNNLQIPQELLNDPNKAIQYLMNTGKLSQQQYDWAVKLSKQFQNDPQFMQMFKK